jgi:hypothetical protein
VTTIQDCIAVVDRCTASIQAATDRLRWFEMHSMLGLEPAILPKRRAKKPVKPSAPKTQRMRRDFNEADLAFLERIVAAPSPSTALNAYKTYHQGRVLQPKRTARGRCPLSRVAQQTRETANRAPAR